MNAAAPAIALSPRDRWLQERRRLITASDCAAIIGEDPRRGPLAVWIEKTSELEAEETIPMRRGRRFEAVIAEDYAEQTGRPVGALGEYEITRHPDIPWLGATLDRTTLGTVAAPDPFGGVEFPPEGQRISSATVFSERAPLQLKMAVGSAREWKDEPPLGYVVQVQVEMACYSSTWGALAALIGPGPLATVDLVRDDAFLAALVPELDRFRWHVLHRVPPEADGKPGTSAAIRRLWANDDGETVPLDVEALRLADELEAAQARAGAAEETVKALENRLRARIGGASFGALTDGTFLTLRKTERAGYTVAPTSYRALHRMRPRIRRRG